jgi:hypothetical protein
MFGMRESVVYTMIERRAVNEASMDETVQRAQSEFFPKL